MNITRREAEMIRTALSPLIDDNNKETYAGILEKLVLTPTLYQFSDWEGFMNDCLVDNEESIN
ncbi:hypothetical protein [Pseudalkalibacillus sp. NRS-1564]|uniref:hypothetical protein n=1 Tax=Pseudalkalibacillus sp. NRS-1564 TaxID=3233900 RepID=UPI003D2D59C1